MSYENIWEGHGVYRKYVGTMTGKEIIQAVQEVEGDHRFDSIRYVINDYLDVSGADVSDREVKIIAAIDRAAALTNPDIKVAMVTNSKKIFDMATMYCEMPDVPYPSRTFTELDEARDWVA